jgi:prepilin-type N-terminal cleavage/methylation domain-containing protein
VLKVKRRRGFTLSELLVVLSFIAIIATFSIGKLLTSFEENVLRNTEKEFFTTISQVFFQGIQDGTLPKDVANTSLTSYNTYISERLNAIKVCNNNMIAEGCRTTVTTFTTGIANWTSPGFILHNGATVTLGKAGVQTPPFLTIRIDWNGDKLPNQHTGSTTLLTDDTTMYFLNLGNMPVTYTSSTGCVIPNVINYRLVPGCGFSNRYKSIFAD